MEFCEERPVIMAKKAAIVGEKSAFDLGLPAEPAIPQRGSEKAEEPAKSPIVKSSFTMEANLFDDVKLALFRDKIKFQGFMKACAKMYLNGEISAEMVKRYK